MTATKTIQLRAYERAELFKVKAYVDSHLNEVLTAEDMALWGDISLHKLKAGFVLLFNSSFAKYVKDRRMEKARDLLLDTNKIIYEIARECGYRDGAAFVRAFRKWFGQTPDVFRKK